MSVAARKALQKRIQKRAACYFYESTRRKELEPQTRSDLAHTAAELFETLHCLTHEKLLGNGKAEETRTITSIAGVYRRCMNDLGLTEGETIDGELPEL